MKNNCKWWVRPALLLSVPIFIIFAGFLVFCFFSTRINNGFYFQKTRRVKSNILKFNICQILYFPCKMNWLKLHSVKGSIASCSTNFWQIKLFIFFQFNTFQAFLYQGSSYFMQYSFLFNSKHLLIFKTKMCHQMLYQRDKYEHC